MCYEFSSCIQTFLQEISCLEYEKDFRLQGFDRACDIATLSSEDLDIIGINDVEHRRIILNGAQEFQSSPLHKLNNWLTEFGLEYYFVNFKNSELVNFEDIQHLEVNNELCDDLEIVLPGHRKRLKIAVSQLRKRRLVEEPLAKGYWGVPHNLDKGQNMFLLLEAGLKSKSSNETVNCVFMVDTGSDVVTVTDDIFEKLDLEILGPVTSEGVHASKKSTKLYRALLVIGEEEIEVEVLRENHNSIGNLAFRHFRHYITGNKHHWLKGDYRSTSLPYLSAPSSPVYSPESLVATTLVSESLLYSNNPSTSSTVHN